MTVWTCWGPRVWRVWDQVGPLSAAGPILSRGQVVAGSDRCRAQLYGVLSSTAVR
jgi:hypothetical protein